MNYKCVFLLFLLNHSLCYAQHIAQSKEEPLYLFTTNVYTIIPTVGLTATHVKTKRTEADRETFLDIINIILPDGFVSNKLIMNRDINDVGLNTKDVILVSMSVLPDIKTGQIKWIPINIDSIPQSKQVAWQRVASDSYVRLFNYEALGGPPVDWSRRRLDLHPIIKMGQQYFTVNQTVLTEYFLLRNRPTWYPTVGDNATINCLARPFTPIDYTIESEKAVSSIAQGHEAPQLRKELSTKLLLRSKENNVCTFWSLPPTIADGNIATFGVGDLKFKPQVGLISGKYSQYFNLDNNDPVNKFFELISIQQISF